MTEPRKSKRYQWFIFTCTMIGVFVLVVSMLAARQTSAVPTAEQAKVTLPWTDDYALALQRAKDEGKPILMNFTGSDWCVWCHRLEDEIFYTEYFRQNATEQFVLFIADFPRAIVQSDALKAQNQALSEKYSVRGFPTIIVIDANENVLAQSGYNQSRKEPQSWLAHLNELIQERKR